MRLVIVYNPVSGAGRAAAMSGNVCQALERAGHSVQLIPSRLEDPRHWLDERLRDADAMVVAGGDGAVRLAAPASCRTDTPIYHLACGTENLFAREFGMSCEPAALLCAIEDYRVRRIDLGTVNGRCFVLMASVGYDAEVVHDLALRRGASISHLSYLWPVLRQLYRWRPPRVQIHVDGERIDDGGPGFVVVANSAQYGWRLNPAGRAVVDDGLLDVAFFPAASRRAVVQWAWLCRRGRQFDDGRLIYKRGRRVRITSQSECHYQIDGDPPGVIHELSDADPLGVGLVDQEAYPDDASPLSLRIDVHAGRLPVLTP